jgi:3-carboxy-cis,cis-muconate cycloisomerase
VSVSPFDSVLLADLLGDGELAPLFGDRAAIAAMIRVECALARAGARAGILPRAAAEAIEVGLAGWAPDPGDLAAGTARAGVAVPPLLAAARARLAPEAAHWLHWGATSQDIVDTALALRLATALDILVARIARLEADLSQAAARWADLPMAGRTRAQAAAPIAFGDRCAAWAAPLADLAAEARALRPRIARIQLGGAVGTNAVLGPRASAVMAALAEELDLVPAPAWHTNRAGPIALGHWCAAAAGAAGKIAGDLLLMGRSESGEARAGSGGGSSTMPQKANPVAAETVVALARYAATLAAPMHLAALHAEERDGAAWMLEWLALPQLVLAAGVALRHAGDLAASLDPDPDRMRARLVADGGAVMAEAAVFLLARTRLRAEAEAIVRRALAERRPDESLATALARLAPDAADWESELRPETVIRRG